MGPLRIRAENIGLSPTTKETLSLQWGRAVYSRKTARNGVLKGWRGEVAISAQQKQWIPRKLLVSDKIQGLIRYLYRNGCF